MTMLSVSNLRPWTLALLAAGASLWVGSASAASGAEFNPAGRAYESEFQRASAELMRLVKEDEIKVLAVAEFTDMEGRPSYIGRVFAEEFSTLLVSQATGKKRARVLDPNSIVDFMNDKEEGGGNPLASNKALKRFGKNSKAELLLSGKLTIGPKELRLFLRALNTESGGIRWASTVVVQGTAAGYVEPAAAAPAVASPSALVAPAAASVAAPAVSAPVLAAPAVSAPNLGAPVVAAPTIAAPTIAAPAIAAPTITAPTIATPTIAAPRVSAPVVAAPAAAAEPPRAAPRQAQHEFDNGVVRATLRNVQKFPDQGWATAVIDIINVGGAPLVLDIAAGDPGTGTDDKGNSWKVERVTGLKMVEKAGPDMTALAPNATMPVVLVLTTSGRPLGDQLSFTANVLWYSPSAQDGGRLGMNFTNVKL
jgi:hypothetical protein